MSASEQQNILYCAEKLVARYRRFGCVVEGARCNSPADAPWWLAAAYNDVKNEYAAFCPELEEEPWGILRFHSHFWNLLVVGTHRAEFGHVIVLEDDFSIGPYKAAIWPTWKRDFGGRQRYHLIFIRVPGQSECWYATIMWADVPGDLQSMLRHATPPFSSLYLRFNHRRKYGPGPCYSDYFGGLVTGDKDLITDIVRAVYDEDVQVTTLEIEELRR